MTSACEQTDAAGSRSGPRDPRVTLGIAVGASTPTRKRILRAIGYGIFLLVASWIGLEILVRLSGLADHLYTGPAFESSPRGDYWRYKAGFEGTVLGPTRVRIGPSGARLHNPAGPERDGVYVVAIVGDSITFGQAVEETRTFSAVLERRLAASGIPVEVLNYGVQGHNLEMEVAHLADRLAEIHPNFVILAFVSDDLNPDRAENHVDRFGYLTKNVFGAPSFWGDLARASLRQSYLALLGKDLILQSHMAGDGKSASDASRSAEVSAELQRFRTAMQHFQEATGNVGRMVACLDLRETPLTRAIAQVMSGEFPNLRYVHAPPLFDTLPLETLRVPRDGHPNGTAHERYAEMLLPPVLVAVQSQTAGSNARHS